VFALKEQLSSKVTFVVPYAQPNIGNHAPTDLGVLPAMVTPHIMQEAGLRGMLEQYNLTLVYMY
jgi:hypothetical protein